MEITTEQDITTWSQLTFRESNSSYDWLSIDRFAICQGLYLRKDSLGNSKVTVSLRRAIGKGILVYHKIHVDYNFARRYATSLIL